MIEQITTLPITDIVLDETIYPRARIDQKRVALFAENIRAGFPFDPIEVQAHPSLPGKYRILDGVHRWSAYKTTGITHPTVIIIHLNAADPLLYAAQKAIGPRQLTEEESKDTARRAFQNNPRLASELIGKAIGRTRRAVNLYIADLRAAMQMELDLKIFHMDRLGIPQERIAKRLGTPQRTISDHLAKKEIFPDPLKAELSRGFTVSQVAEKHNWPLPLVWSLALEGKDDHERFKHLAWGLRTWDLWGWPDCDKRFGDDWPGRIPAQLIGHLLYYFTKQNDLIFDPMAGGGVTPDTCLAFNRRCWAMDMIDSPEKRSEIEPHFWDIKNNTPTEFFKAKEKPDLIIFDPPYFDKKAKDYDPQSIAALSRKDYLAFLESILIFLKEHTKKTTRLAFINADWRNFQHKPAFDEVPEDAILIDDYLSLLRKTGWPRTHHIQAPLSSERFEAGVVAAMQNKRILGVTSRYILVTKQH